MYDSGSEIRYELCLCAWRSSIPPLYRFATQHKVRNWGLGLVSWGRLVFHLYTKKQVCWALNHEEKNNSHDDHSWSIYSIKMSNFCLWCTISRLSRRYLGIVTHVCRNDWDSFPTKTNRKVCLETLNCRHSWSRTQVSFYIHYNVSIWIDKWTAVVFYSANISIYLYFYT